MPASLSLVPDRALINPDYRSFPAVLVHRPVNDPALSMPRPWQIQVALIYDVSFLFSSNVANRNCILPEQHVLSGALQRWILAGHSAEEIEKADWRTQRLF
jgi:hypothetical protein